MRLVVAALLSTLSLPARAQDVQEQQPLRPPEPAPPSAHRDCVGRWEGTSSDLDPQGRVYSAYRMTLEITAMTGPECGRIEYAIGCGGPLRACTSPGADRVAAVEHYTHNTGCAPAGRIEATCTGDVMQWRWFETTTSTGNTSTATLRRVVDSTPAPSVVPPPPVVPPSTPGGCGGCALARPSGTSGLFAFGAVALLRARRRPLVRDRSGGCASGRRASTGRIRS